MIKYCISVMFVFDRVISGVNKQWLVDERITFEYHEEFAIINDLQDEVTHVIHQLERPPTTKSVFKRQLPDDEQLTWRVVVESTPEYVYDYDQFKAEYDVDIEQLKQDRAKLNASDFVTTNITLCGADKIYAIGPFTVKCLWQVSSRNATVEVRAQATSKLLRILYIWAGILVLVFAYGCGHAGWCSTLCPFDICYPQGEYERIKRYLALNPPGTLTTQIVRKKDDTSKTVFKKRYFKPSESERYLYEKLWNAIYQT